MKRVLIAVALALGACVAPVSEHPLSDDTDSVVDEELIGWWDLVPGEDSRAKLSRHAIVIGRLPDAERTLELVVLSLDDDDHVQVARSRIYALPLNGAPHMSMRGEKALEFTLLRYSIDANGDLAWDDLDLEGVAGAIESDAIAGTVTRGKVSGSGDPALEKVLLTATTEELRGWLKGPGKGLWRRNTNFVLERLPRMMSAPR